jgi:hypothetical protein
MDSVSHNHTMLWLLVVLAAIFSFIGLFISYKILKKFDEFQIATYEALELLNTDRLKVLKEIENLHRRSRILSNETKENKRNRE